MNPVLTEGSFWELVGDLFSICQRLAIMLFSTGNRLARACGKPVANLPLLAGKLSATCICLGNHSLSCA
jgi:hypothetical protein